MKMKFNAISFQIHETGTMKLGSLAKAQAFFYALSFFQLDGFTVRPPQRG
jgi:hypothetical protein